MEGIGSLIIAIIASILFVLAVAVTTPVAIYVSRKINDLLN